MVEILLKKEDYEKEYGVKLEFVLHGKILNIIIISFLSRW